MELMFFFFLKLASHFFEASKPPSLTCQTLLTLVLIWAHVSIKLEKNYNKMKNEI